MLHKNIIVGDRHAPHSYEYANAAARTGATGFVTDDLHKLGLQLDDGTLWRLSATTPAWVQLGSSGAGVAAVRTPTNVTPASGTTGVAETPTLTGSAYLSLYGLTMSAAQFQASTAADFATTVLSTGDVAGTAVSYTLSAGILVAATVYYWRVRYKDSDGVYSDWSTAFSFTAAAAPTGSYIATPSATPAALGDALEGGFYTGMIWNELVQSATSTLIGTGSKAFTVADMTATPLVYAGQTLEVRSRANPANKMIGVVTGALTTSLTISVTSVGGSGTFTDWSIMSRYRVIVAPKATGETLSILYKNAMTASPAACDTVSEGRKATLAMVAADTSTVYPAAHWCNNLSIAGKTDWYLPSRDELELCWRNLKPAIVSNYQVARTNSALNYTTLGAFGDATTGMGENRNSSPVGAAYTTDVPPQTPAVAFRSGGTEAFAYEATNYWSSSNYSVTFGWFMSWFSTYPGFETYNNKNVAYAARAVRRSII